MKSGKVFELFVKTILMEVGFLEVKSDGLFVFDGAAGQMIQGLGEAHNADVLLEPPVQTPFLYQTRLLIECKDYTSKIGLNTVRSALGLREDINHFEMVDVNELKKRMSQRRRGIIETKPRFVYQVILASMNGYTKQAQKFATTHRIPLIEFDKMIFWNEYKNALNDISTNEKLAEIDKKNKIIEFAQKVGEKLSVAITNSGQLLFLYRQIGKENSFSDDYRLFWIDPKLSWKMTSGECQYTFYLSDEILKHWLENVNSDFELRKEAINCKETVLSSMIVYYREHGKPTIKMISINKEQIKEAKKLLKIK